MHTPRVPRHGRRPLWLAVALALVLIAAPAAGQSVQKVVLTGETLPGGVLPDAPYLGIVSAPIINASGQVLLPAFVPNPTNPAFAVPGVWVWTPGAGSQFVAQVGGPAPGTGANFSAIDTGVSLTLDGTGQVTFRGSATGGPDGLWAGPAGGLGLVARIGADAPGTDPGVTFSPSDFAQAPVLNGGRVAFSAYLIGPGVTSENASGIWVGAPGNLALAVRGGDPVPGFAAGTTFGTAGGPLLNTAGDVVFASTFSGPEVGSNVSGLWVRPAGGAAQLVAKFGDTLPGANPGQTLEAISAGGYSINDVGDVLLTAKLTNSGGGPVDGYGYWVGRPGALQMVARDGDQAPGTPAGVAFTRLVFGEPGLNRTGQVSFLGRLTGAGVTTDNDIGIYAGPAGDVRLIAREGAAAPGAGAGVRFAFLHDNLYPDTVLADGGQMAFRTDLAGTGVNATNSLGVWIGDREGELIKVVRTGDPFAVAPGDTRTVSDVLTYGVGGGEDGRRAGINDFGQVPLHLTFTDGTNGVFVWTPDLRWRISGGGADDWGNNLKWTLSLAPAHVHKVTIDPATDVTVTGPAANAAVRSLQIGGGAGRATLVTRPGVTLTAAEGVTVTTNGVLAGTGTVAGAVTVGGTIAPGTAAEPVGTLTTGGQTWAGGGAYQISYDQITGPFAAGTDNDLLSSTGALTVTATPGNKFRIRMDYTGTETFLSQPPDVTIRIATFAGGVPASFDLTAFELEGDVFVGGSTFTLFTQGNDVFLTFTPVPEPAAVLAAAAAGLVGARAVRRRRATLTMPG